MFTAGEDSRSLTEKLIGILRKEAQAVAVGRGCCSKEEGCCAPGETHEADLPVDQMEFWGTEVAPGKPQVNEPGDDTYVHVSQVALGPSKDGKSERVVIRVESGGKNVVLGTLCSGKVDQMTLDLIFDREFKLSHTSTSSSVFFCGYRTDKQQEEYDDESEEDEDEEDDDDEDDEPVPTAVLIKENGTVSEGKATKKQLKVVEKVEAKPKKADIPKPSLVEKEAEEGEESDDEDDDDEDEDSDGEEDNAIRMDFGIDDYDEEDDSSFEVDDDAGILESSDEDEDDSDEDDEDEDDEDDEDEDDEDDLAAELGKKRSLQSSAKKTPGEGKKPRLDTPAKPGSQTAAEYWESLIIASGKGLITTPGKKGAKGAGDPKLTPVSTKKEKESKGAVAKTPQKTPGKETTVKTPKTTPPGAGASAKKLGAHHCAECDRNFATDSALSQHGIAKHKK